MFQTVELPFPTRLRVSPAPLVVHSFYVKPRIRIRIRIRSRTRGVSSIGCYYQTVGVQASLDKKVDSRGKRRVFLLDVNPLCYDGNKPSLECFGNWVSLLFREVSMNEPVIAVVDGERGSEQRRSLLASYKAQRWKYVSNGNGHVGRWHKVISQVFEKCNVPLVRMEGHEADDVIATLSKQALEKGYKVVIASPDKDFKQLLCEDVQMVMPMVELGRWSFYTLNHYASQYNCHPCLDLSIRSILGDEVDGVPGIQQLSPGFGRKTALKLLKKHSSLENLLNTAAVRSVAKHYAQDALLKHAHHLRRNYQLLSLRTDLNVSLHQHWLLHRDSINDATVFSAFFNKYVAT